MKNAGFVEFKPLHRYGHFRSGGATTVALSKVFGLLGLIISFAGLFLSSQLSVALKCARHNCLSVSSSRKFLFYRFLYVHLG